MARVLVRPSFVTLLLGGIGVAHGMFFFSSRQAHLVASSLLSVGDPPTEQNVLDALGNVNASLRTAEDAIHSANSTAHSILDNALQAMGEFSNMLGTLATATGAGPEQSLTKEQASQATRFVDTVGDVVETAEANVSIKLDGFSKNLSIMLPTLSAIGKQITTQFLEALTMVEDLDNVSQSEESLEARQAAKRAARQAVRALRALSDDGVDDEDTPPEQVGVLKRLVDKFGWDAAKRILRRAVSKLHGEEDAEDEENPKATYLLVSSAFTSDDNADEPAEELEARSLLDGHVLGALGVEYPEDLEAALLRKGPLDIDRHDACAQATQKIFHANKTIHKLSRKFSWVKTTVHRSSVIAVGAGATGIDSINRTALSSLAEVSDVLEQPVSRELRKFAKVRFHMGGFAEHKSLMFDALSTLAKTTPLADTLRSAVDETCLSGACGEAAQKACEASMPQATLAASSSLPVDAPVVAPSSALPVAAPPTEKEVLDALLNVNASLSTVEDAIESANSTAYSMADNTLEAIAELQNAVGSVATLTGAGLNATLIKDRATQATRFIDTVGRSVATAKANVSTKMDDFSKNLSATKPLLYAVGLQITTQFLEALTLVEGIYNVSQSEESLYARKIAKRTARRAVRQLSALGDDGADDEDTPPEQVGVLRRLVDKFGWDAAKRILRRAVSKLHGDEDAEDEESQKAISFLVSSGLDADDNAESASEETEAQLLLEEHALTTLGVEDPEDLEAALLRKGPLDIDRHDACAQATQKIFHANKTLHKLSRKFSWVKTTVHRSSVISMEADVAAIDSVNSTAYSSLAELPYIHEHSVARELRMLGKVRCHMGGFAEHKSLMFDALSTLAKTTPLADTLRTAVDDKCLSGACGEAAQKACEASMPEATLVTSSSLPVDAVVATASPLPEEAPPAAQASALPVDAPTTEKQVLDALLNVNASLNTADDAIESANNTAYSLADNTLEAIAEVENAAGSVATATDAGLTKDQATQATRFIDTVGRSVATARANVSTKMDAFSNNLSVSKPLLHAVGKQITSQFLEALTMVEGIYNVSQSEDSLYARQMAKRAARQAVRQLKASSDDVADDEDAPPEQVGVLRRLVDKFGWDAAKRILRRAASKLHGEEDAEDEESPKATSLLMSSAVDSDDNPDATAEESEARSLLDGHVLGALGVEYPEDLEAALLRKGPLDIDRHDACAEATQKIYHANKTVHKLSRKFSWVKTTVHRTSVISVEADVAAIDSVNSTAYSSLAELSDIHEHSVSRELRALTKVRFHMGRFAEHKSLMFDALSTIAKTTPLADTLRSDVDKACLAGVCGETAQKACEASAV